jgi:hypothetical protein
MHSHQLYGCSKGSPTYVSNTKLILDSITGECGTAFVIGAFRAIRALMFSFADCDNSIDVPNTANSDLGLSATQVDVTCLKLHFWAGGNTVFLVKLLEGMHMKSDSLVNILYSSRSVWNCPSIEAIVLSREEKHLWQEVVSAEFSAQSHSIMKHSNWIQKKEKQLQYIAQEDAETRRCTPLYEDELGITVDDNGMIIESVLNMILCLVQPLRFRNDAMFELPFESKSYILSLA